MDLSKIKNLVKQNGDKFVFIENGEPEVVMMSWPEYQKLVDHNRETQLYANNTNSEYYSVGSADLREEPLPQTEFIPPVIAETVGLSVRLEDIHLEDLPI